MWPRSGARGAPSGTKDRERPLQAWNRLTMISHSPSLNGILIPEASLSIGIASNGLFRAGRSSPARDQTARMTTASWRIVSKERIGARWKITREKKSLTPYARVLARFDVADEVKRRLEEEHEKLNPLLLKREIDRRLTSVFDVHIHHRKPKSGKKLR